MKLSTAELSLTVFLFPFFSIIERGVTHRISSDKPKEFWLRSKASVLAFAGEKSAIWFLGIRVGSQTDKWSCKSIPAGTNTTQRFPN